MLHQERSFVAYGFNANKNGQQSSSSNASSSSSSGASTQNQFNSPLMLNDAIKRGYPSSSSQQVIE
jgi:hypothetical protein